MLGNTPVITLLTDFGLHDTYVGQVKGAILSVAPSAAVVDLTHAVPPQDVLAGAFLLWSAVETFPPGTIHVAVVDPGVGSSRRALAIRAARGDTLVGPDNGLLLPATYRLGGLHDAVALTKQRYWRPDTSATFHGRDIFGPVAAHLARGVPLSDFGPPASDLVDLRLPEPHGLEGEVIHVDVYGNLVTNLPAASLPPRFDVLVAGRSAPFALFYGSVAPGELLAEVGSNGLLEISVRDGSATKLTGAARGTPVSLQPL
ncbi:MAG: SAM-dependent chlorinase/fluorinase [Chloroflexi bacterium]|nr:SAM-dependent chlorinase/fluorinase [Chloroflexota bacterium]